MTGSLPHSILVYLPIFRCGITSTARARVCARHQLSGIAMRFANSAMLMISIFDSRAAPKSRVAAVLMCSEFECMVPPTGQEADREVQNTCVQSGLKVRRGYALGVSA